jgi:hypothetical protein
MSASREVGSTLPFTRRALNLWLPASANLGVASILAPAINALLARTHDPEVSIAAFAIALGVIGVVALPQWRIQQLTLVFLNDHQALGNLRRFVLATAVVVGAISLLVALSPLAELILTGIFSAKGELLSQARAGLVALSPFPSLMVVRTHLHGSALRLGRARLVWLGTVIGAGGAVVITAVLLVGGLQGPVAAGWGTTIAATVETVVLLAVTRRLVRQELPERSVSGADASLGAITRFFAPLVFAALLPAATTPLLNAALARAVEPEASIAAFAIALGLFQFITLLLWGAQPTVLALLGQGEAIGRVARLSIGVAATVMIASLAAAFVPPFTEAIIEGISGARDRLAELSILGLRILAPLPLILILEQIFSSALMQVRRTRPIFYVNIWRLITLLAFVGIALTVGTIPGVALGAGAWAASLAVEAVATVLYGRGSYRNLAAKPLLASTG